MKRFYWLMTHAALLSYQLPELKKKNYVHTDIFFPKYEYLYIITSPFPNGKIIINLNYYE